MLDICGYSEVFVIIYVVCLSICSSKRNQQAADGLEVSPVHRYLQEYFTKIAEDSDHQHVRMDMSLYLICVKSIEVRLPRISLFIILIVDNVI